MSSNQIDRTAKAPALFGFSLKSVARGILVDRGSRELLAFRTRRTSMRNILYTLSDSLRTSYEFIRFSFIFVFRKNAEKSTSKLFSAYHNKVHFTSTVRRQRHEKRHYDYKLVFTYRWRRTLVGGGPITDYQSIILFGFVVINVDIRA